MNPEAPNQEANPNPPQPPVEPPAPQGFQPQPAEQPQNTQPVPPQPVVQQPPVGQPFGLQPMPGQSPQQPMPMGAPVAPMSPASTGPKLSKKLIGLIAGGVVLFSGLLVLLVVLFAGPSKADYKQAMDTTDTAREAWSKIAGVYVSSSSTQTELANSVDTMKTAKSDLFTQLDTLAKSKAVTGDKDLKEKWKAVSDKKSKLDAALSARIEAYEKIYPIVIAIDSSPSTPAEAQAMLKDAQSKIGSISGLNDENNKKYVERIKTDLDKLIVVLDKVIEMRQNPAKYDSATMNTYYDLTTELTDADRDWSSNMNKQMDDSDIRKEMSALSTAIADKYYKMK